MNGRPVRAVVLVRSGDTTKEGSSGDTCQRGEALLLTTARLKDVVNPTRGQLVPMSARSDRTRVWGDATTCYRQTHRLLPDPEMVTQHPGPEPSALDRRRRRDGPGDGGAAEVHRRRTRADLQRLTLSKGWRHGY